MERVQPSFADQGECIVLFKEELACCIEPNSMGSKPFPDVLGLRDNEIHSLIPGGADELAILADKWMRKATTLVDGIPSVELSINKLFR